MNPDDDSEHGYDDNQPVISLSSHSEIEPITEAPTFANASMDLPPLAPELESCAGSASSSTGSPRFGLSDAVRDSSQPQGATFQGSSLQNYSPIPLRRDEDRSICAEIESPRPASPDWPDRATAESSRSAKAIANHHSSPVGYQDCYQRGNTKNKGIYSHAHTEQEHDKDGDFNIYHSVEGLSRLQPKRRLSLDTPVTSSDNNANTLRRSQRKRRKLSPATKATLSSSNTTLLQAQKSTQGQKPKNQHSSRNQSALNLHRKEDEGAREWPCENIVLQRGVVDNQAKVLIHFTWDYLKQDKVDPDSNIEFGHVTDGHIDDSYVGDDHIGEADGSQWEVQNIIGEEVINGNIFYKVAWKPTLEPECNLAHMQDLLKAWKRTKAVGYASNSTGPGQEVQKRGRGRARKRV
ncbi:hypothetical protein VM1G_12003 [Cytospora mali]|uniref:Chromo domain-containing protein n=1 Tax=Cytospora mali TaxID=578113 RepID=A0A194VHS8_CYTMA|nr:hypothetical protein VM1G_12003 [Valsa mali]